MLDTIYGLARFPIVLKGMMELFIFLFNKVNISQTGA